MKILLIGHAYVAAENQKRVEILARQPGVELQLVIPHVWREPVLKEIAGHLPAAAAYAVRRTRAVWAGTEQYYWYMSADLGLRSFQPDILCVEQGAGSFVYAQSLIYRNFYAPRARAVFFTWWNLPYRARWPLSALERFNLSQSQGAVVGNQDAAGIVRDHGFKGPLTVLPQLGVDPDEYRPEDAGDLRRQLGLDRFTVGFTGRFVEEKGLRVLMAALRGSTLDCQVLLLGRGPLEAELKAWADEPAWRGRVKIVSGVGHSQIARYQNCMHVMAVPSLTRPFWKEQFGHVIIEAMACGVPVIGSDSAEVPNVIGPAGLVTPEGDAAALRAAIEGLAGSADLRAKLAAAGRQRVLEHYTNQRVAQSWLAFFQALPDLSSQAA